MKLKIKIYLFSFIFFILLLIVFSNLVFSEKYLLLSFDTETTDNNETIINLLNLLSKYDAKATFFVTIEFVKVNPELLLLINYQGHEIACHTINHPHLTKINYTQKFEEINGCKDYLQNNYDISVVGFRAPYRQIDYSTFKILKQTKYSYDASIFSGLKLFYPNFFIKEIYTSSYGIFPIDDYVILESLHLSPKVYFWMLNNYAMPYKSFSFHPHLIMENEEEFDKFLSSQKGKKITHKQYLEVIN
jgi:peptidoglycan/xylan/chitin deacetylase (PgdA/CDA1 family)